MFNHMAGRQLNRAAGRQLARGNIVGASLLHGAATRQHIMGTCRRMMWSPWLASNWLIRRSIRRSMIAMTCTIALASTIPIHETVVVMSPEKQLVVVPEDSSFKPCSQHSIVDLSEIIQVTFDQGGKQTTLYADRKCSRCGQHFFCYPSDEPPPYTVPGSSQAQAPAPMPSSQKMPPPQQQVHQQAPSSYAAPPYSVVPPQQQPQQQQQQQQQQPQQQQQQPLPGCGAQTPYPPAPGDFPQAGSTGHPMPMPMPGGPIGFAFPPPSNTSAGGP